MEFINTKNSKHKDSTNQKGCSGGIKQLELNFDASIGSHNIYGVKSTQFLKPLRKLDKPGRTIRLNKLGSPNTLNIPVNLIKSYYKDDIYRDVYIELSNTKDPIPVRESVDEIAKLIYKRSV